VIDDGPGIDPARVDDLFEPFGAAGDRGRPASGSGTGLAVARSLVEAMGGELRIDSHLGEGTTVTVRLPGAPARTG
jgi:two-component system sensor histidine kinase TorS